MSLTELNDLFIVPFPYFRILDDKATQELDKRGSKYIHLRHRGLMLPWNNNKRVLNPHKQNIIRRVALIQLPYRIIEYEFTQSLQLLNLRSFFKCKDDAVVHIVVLWLHVGSLQFYLETIDICDHCFA